MLRAQTSPAAPRALTPAYWEPGARVVSQVARYQPHEADRSQRIQLDLGSGIARATDTRALRSSSAQRSLFVDGDSTRLERRQGRAVSCGSRGRASGQAESSTPRPVLQPRPLSPLPLFLVKPCGCWRVKEAVIAVFPHAARCIGPASAGPGRSANHNATWPGLEFNFVLELSFLEQRLRQPYTP